MKHFEPTRQSEWSEVLRITVAEDEASRTVLYVPDEGNHRIWVLREIPDYAMLFVEVFEALQDHHGMWWLRGWGEEEGIPFDDCPEAFRELKTTLYQPSPNSL